MACVLKQRQLEHSTQALASEAEPKGVAASEACSGEAAHLAQLELLAAEVEHLALLKQPARAARQVDQRPAAAVEPVKEHPS